MVKRHLWLIALALGTMALVVILAGCGNNDGQDATPSPQPTPLPPPTVDPFAPTETPKPPPTPLPPTWTPPPTVTQPPRVTIDYTYSRPTATDLILPTYTFTAVPPSPTPPGPVLLLTPDALNQAVSSKLFEGSGGFFEAPPTITFQDGVLLASLNVLMIPGDMTSARAVVIRATVVPEQGRVQLTNVLANFTDTNEVYSDELVDNLSDTIQAEINTLVANLYEVNNPGGAAFFVSWVETSPIGISIQTVIVQ
ncbi:MAG: hypothetical protein JXQ72_09950 [Anaerolineae bacterium]|nr:hypothetical protein [Anaerolineae bacterium]